jgi:putative membrane protein
MTPTVLRATGALIGILALAAPALAQRPSAPPSTEQESRASTLSQDTKAFVVRAARENLAEIELGKIGLERSVVDSVKAFAQRMVTAHGSAQQELAGLAQRKGVALPSQPSLSGPKAFLTKVDAPRFDREYILVMIRDHEKQIDDFRRHAEHGRDPDVKAWAARMLPQLEEHLRMAQEIERSFKRS